MSDGDLLVVPDGEPHAFALPAWRKRAGRIVVTTGLLRTPGPAEREVLFGHERAHLKGNHHLLSLTANLAAAIHPALRSLRPAVDFHLERWADESAASSVGNRRLAATAIARAALAASAAEKRPGKPRAPSDVRHGAGPQRVEALLRPAPVRPQGHRTRAAITGLVTTVSVSALSGRVLACRLHEYVEFTAGALPAG